MAQSTAIEKPLNSWGGLGRWAFLETTNPWDAESLIRSKRLMAEQVVST